MDNKLQELTQKLYEEGLAKGRSEAAAVLAQAKETAQNTLEQAREEAAALLAKAQKDAEEYRTQVAADIRMASRQTLSTLKQQIENLVLEGSLRQSVKTTLQNPDCLRDMMLSLVKTFNPSGAEGENPIIGMPAAQQEQLRQFLADKAGELLHRGVTIQTDEKLDSGFSIAPKDGSYCLRFSEDDFISLFSRYLRPHVRELLFKQ